MHIYFSIQRRVLYGTMNKDKLFLKNHVTLYVVTSLVCQADRSTHMHMLTQKDVCPLSPTPPSAGGSVKASVGIQLEQRITIRYTHVLGTSKAHEPCVLLTLLHQAKQEPNRDMTKACPRCSRTVRVQSTK